MSPFCDLISNKTNKNNTNIAIIDSELNKFTYAELYQSISEKIILIKQAELKKNDLFILQIDKSFESLSYLLACIQLGVIYIPVEVNTPEKRLTSIINNSKANAILKPDFSIKTLQQIEGYKQENALCVMYTSGSTGTPKGVVISKSGLKDFIDWSINEFSITSNDLLTAFAPFHFDLSTFDIF
jgi:acyl-coenzyme A synthetase/AMP-(fatty) acid ligase